jgi:hypothetical protein
MLNVPSAVLGISKSVLDGAQTEHDRVATRQIPVQRGAISLDVRQRKTGVCPTNLKGNVCLHRTWFRINILLQESWLAITHA